MEQKKWNDAAIKARDAYFLRPTEPHAWRAFASVLTRTGQWAPAIEWWKKIDDAHRLTAEDRRDYVGAALVTGDVFAAAKQVEALLAQSGGPAPIDLVFAGQVAARHNDPALAIDYAQRALANKRARPKDVLAAATLILSVTSPYAPEYANAWQQIEAVARDSKNPASLDALTLLARQEALPPLKPLSNPSLSLESNPQPSPTSATEAVTSADATTAKDAPSPAAAAGASPPAVAFAKGSPSPNKEAVASPGTFVATGDASNAPAVAPSGSPQNSLALNLAATPPPTSSTATMSATEVANALENHPEARTYHKLLALELRARHEPALADQYVRDAVEKFGNAARLAQTYQQGTDAASETLLALASWLNKIGRADKTLEVLPEANAIQRQDLFVQYLNALAALKRWNEIKDLLMAEHSVIDPMLQHTYLAIAQAHLGSATSATNEWQRALQVANTADKLVALATYAEQNSANDIADAAYAAAIKIVPTSREMYAGRLRVALETGHTAQAQEIAAEMARLWPDDPEARNQDAYLRLLLGASGDSAETAQREAQVLVAKEPRNWQARATLGLACLRLGRKEDALVAIRQPRVTGVEPSGALAVRAAILAANGYDKGARNDAKLLSAKPLLPEERALIAPLLQ